jgi:hypothetical protein
MVTDRELRTMLEAAVSEQRAFIRDQLGEIKDQRELRRDLRAFMSDARTEFGDQRKFRRHVRGVLLRPAQADASGVAPFAPVREAQVGVAPVAKLLGVDRKTVYGYCHLPHDPLPHEYSKVDGKGKGKLLFFISEVVAWRATRRGRRSGRS